MKTLLPVLTLVILVIFSIVPNGEGRKKIVIHVPYEIKVNHHTHTIYKHALKEPKESYEVIGYSYDKKLPTTKWKPAEKEVITKWKEPKQESYWKESKPEFLPSHWNPEISAVSWSDHKKKPSIQSWKETTAKIIKGPHKTTKNPHKIASYDPSYNPDEKLAEILSSKQAVFEKSTFEKPKHFVHGDEVVISSHFYGNKKPLLGHGGSYEEH